MANPGNLAAQALVNQLKAGGMSYAEIGRRVGRDSSLISQIGRKGNKGASLVSALQGIAGGATTVNVPRRTGKAGTTAKTRTSKKTITTKHGVTSTVTSVTKGPATLKKELGLAASGNNRVRWDIKAKRVKTKSDPKGHEGWISGHLPSGWTSQDLVDRINNPQSGDKWSSGDVNGALTAIALEQNSSQVTSISGIIEYNLLTTEN